MFIRCRAILPWRSVFVARLGNHLLRQRLHPDTSLREYVHRCRWSLDRFTNQAPMLLVRPSHERLVVLITNASEPGLRSKSSLRLTLRCEDLCSLRTRSIQPLWIRFGFDLQMKDPGSPFRRRLRLGLRHCRPRRKAEAMRGGTLLSSPS